MKKFAFLTVLLLLAGGLRAADSAPEVLTLPQAQATALLNHPRVAIAKLRELVAGEIVKQNQAAYYPSANAYLDAVEAGNSNTRILAGGLNNPVIFDRVADGMSITELITDFGRTRNQVAAARLSAKAETEAAAATDEQILLNVDANYFNALETRAVLQVAEQTLQARQLLVDRVSSLARNQLKSDLDVSFAQVALEQSRLLLEKADNDAAASQASLSAALGYRDTRNFQLADVPPPIGNPSDLETLIAAAIASRPNLVRLRYEREASARLARAEKDRNYPTVAAIGTIGNAISHDNRLPNKYAAGGIAVDFPLFAGGSYRARQHQAELQAQIAGENLREQEDNTTRDVRLAWLNFNTSVQRLRTTEQLLKHANQAYALAQARYKIGSSSIVELSDAQVNATAAQIADANARYDVLIQRAILDYQTGGLHP